MEINDHISADCNQIGHIIYTFDMGVALCNPILDCLHVLFKIIQQLIIISVQKLTDTLTGTANRKFRADRNLIGRS